MSEVPSNLSELVAPFPEPDFLELMRSRELKLLHGTGASRYGNVLGWDALRGLIERGEHPRGLRDFRLVRESVNAPPERWLTRSGPENRNRVDIGKVEDFLTHGFSLVITPIDRFVPAFAALCDSMRGQLSERTKVGVVVTTGTAGAFRLHYDPEDLIILQVEGTKRWRIYGPAVRYPLDAMPKPPQPPELDPIFDEILRPGDLLYVPGGNWHHCENGPNRSVHLGVFFIAPTPWHALEALTRQLLSEEKFRRPLTRLETASELAALETELKNSLVEKIGQLSLGEFRDAWARRRNIQ
jgi:hypothetical protein